MTRENEDVRIAARRKGVYLWQVAERYQLSDANFSRLLRKKLTQDKRDYIMQIIEELAGQRREA